MSISKITYKTKTATKAEIYSHLQECNNNFSPHLDERINIKEYAKKIFEKSITFEAWADHILIGLVAAYYNNIKHYSGYITNVSILKNYMRMGIASELMNICIKYARQHKFKEINLQTYRKNISAIQLYKKLGFTEFKNKGNFIFMKLEASNYDL